MNDEEKIRANARLAIEQLGPLSGLGPRFGYNAESVQWVEGFIEKMRSSPDGKEITDQLRSVLGSFLGECIVVVYEGKWKLTPNGWAVDVGGNAVAYPFNKVHKQLQNGVAAGDSILTFFTAIAAIRKQGLSKK